ncbi:MAG: DUF4136 domain-containing protein [Flammeovirgaceae bacterium]|nr:MAG: DUF4136 domain-containing protein [Flammeovirgaceae bacterium]
MKFRKSRLLFMRVPLVPVLSMLMLAGCNLEPQLGELVKDMVVQTQYDQTSINASQNIFTTYATFTIREDTIGFVSTRYTNTYIVDGTGDDFVKPVSRLVRDSVLASGFTKVAPTANPDFAVNVTVLDNFNFFQTITYPAFYPGYYGYYGYYYPFVSTYYSSYGTLVIEIVDVKNYAANGNKYKVIWKAYMGDLYATIDLKAKTMEAVTQAFKQSPYISKD